MVYMLIEIQTRYRYFIMPFFFISAALVFEAMKKRIDDGWDTKIRKLLRRKHL